MKQTFPLPAAARVVALVLLSFISFASPWPDHHPHHHYQHGPHPMLVDTIVGSDFYNCFIWEAIDDPTHGRVNYVDQATSRKQNLTFASSDTFILRADYETVLKPTGLGRNSVRIRSQKTYTQHVAVFDVRHMPEGCGTWPAIWEVKGENWPTGGEIDIMEGVNNQSPNRATLHTTAGCTMPAVRTQTGASLTLDCDWQANYNAGCSVAFPSQTSYGPLFNTVGGGWFAVERTTAYYKVWFWSRHDPSVPHDVKHGSSSVNPRVWGIPIAYFPNTSCDFASHFAEHNIIINLTFCGDWAGNAYASSGCPSTCVDFVDNNPAAFENAYFDFASIRVYQ